MNTVATPEINLTSERKIGNSIRSRLQDVLPKIMLAPSSPSL